MLRRDGYLAAVLFYACVKRLVLQTIVAARQRKIGSFCSQLRFELHHVAPEDKELSLELFECFGMFLEAVSLSAMLSLAVS